MVELHNLVFLSVTILLVIDDNYAQRCSYLDNLEGECKFLRECAQARELLAKANTDLTSLRTLQLLTRSCGYTRTTPKVCCQVNENKNTNINANFIRLGGTHSPHRNFRLLPAIEHCSNTPITDRIVGGKAAPLGAYPWITQIGYLVLKTGRMVYGCAGTVINERTILTAAHCVENIGSQLRPAVIRLGEYNVETDPDCMKQICVSHQDLEIQNITTHPNYQATSKFNDIAIIHVKGKISFDQLFIQPICLPFLKEYGLSEFPETLDNQQTVVAGFGKTKWNRAAGSTVLQDVELTVIPNDVCQSIYAGSTSVKITNSQLCAGGEFGKDSCDGDSGGPIMINYHSPKLSKLIQVGVISYGPKECGNSGLPGVYTRVTAFLDWILDNLEPQT